MGNEFTAADMAPHFGYPLLLIQKIVGTAALTQVVVDGGHHAKMRLRTAYYMQVDAVSDGTTVCTVLHGADIAATVTGAGDAVGHVNILTIADAYKDVDADQSISVTTDGDTSTGDVLFFLQYELIE